MLTLFAKEKEAVDLEDVLEIEKMAGAQDEISRILRECLPKTKPEEPSHRLSIFQRQF